jgi:hypothetical protein
VKALAVAVAAILITFLLLYLAAQGVFEPYVHVECTEFGKGFGDYCSKGKR